ncbi:MAG TPA: glycosyltransferase family 2 protein [Myxococcota bacterium]|nr:glycosyltransferase family 2 protein [Myxococcota bacterium]
MKPKNTTKRRGPGSVSFIVAAYNEAKTIASVLEGIKKHTPGLLEVIVVDDGSTDNTAEIAKQHGATVVNLSPNQGKGVALRAGIEKATGEILMFIDADAQDDPAEIPLLLNAMMTDVHMVIGSRFLGTFLDGSVTSLHHLGNRFLTKMFNLLYKTRITDTQAGFRAIRRSAIDVNKLSAVRYEIETDLNCAVVLGWGRVIEVPVTRAPRQAGRSGFRSFYDGARILLHMIRRRFETSGWNIFIGKVFDFSQPLAKTSLKKPSGFATWIRNFKEVLQGGSWPCRHRRYQ